MLKKCKQCGKVFDTLYPELWAYKIGKIAVIWFCSWKCLRNWERKDGDDMKKLTLEDKKRAVQIAVDGGNPLNFIREKGVKNAAQTWQKIKEYVKDVDPEAYKKLPARLPMAAKDDAEQKPEAEINEAVVQDRPDANDSQEEEKDMIAEEYPLEVAAVYSRIMESGTYKRYNGGVALCGPQVNLVMSEAEWIRFSKEIIAAMKQLKGGRPTAAEMEGGE